MRFESQTPKSLAMRRSFFVSSLAMRKPISLIWNHKKNRRKILAEKSLRKSCDVGLRCEKSACFFRSSDAKCLRFGLSLFGGLACDASARDAKSLAMRVERCEPLRSGWLSLVWTGTPSVSGLSGCWLFFGSLRLWKRKAATGPETRNHQSDWQDLRETEVQRRKGNDQSRPRKKSQSL